MRNIQKTLVAFGVFLAALAPALPDTTAASPRAITMSLALGFVAVGVYLGAPRPDAA